MTAVPRYSPQTAGAPAANDVLAGALRTDPASVRRRTANIAGPALKAAAILWFVVAVLGQLMMVAYVIGFYGRAAALGQFELWNKVLPRGYVPGDTVGNLIVSVHLAFATVVTVGGALQLMPAVRRLAPAFHRWNGRVYLLSVLVMSVGGLIMVWTRGADRDLSQNIAISINALLIVACGGMALRFALARRLDVHRRWALRLFLVVSGGWFFRVALMLWIVVNQGPVGFDPDTFRGPALTVIAFAQYLVPLAVLELYFRAQRSGGARGRLAMAGGLVALTLLMGVGIVAASMILWLPHL